MERKQTTEEARETQKRRTTLRIPTKLYKELEAMSIQTGLTVTSLLIVAIWQNILMQRHKLQ